MDIQINFTQSYAGGGVKVTAVIDNVTHIIDTKELKIMLEKQVSEKGYSVDKSSRQKYPRLHINQ